MEKLIDKERILVQALSIMEPKITKSLLITERNDRDDLEQEIKLKVIEAVINGKIAFPPTFSAFREKFNNRNQRSNFVS